MFEQCLQTQTSVQRVPQLDGHNLRRSRTTNPKLEVLTPQNSQIIFIDKKVRDALKANGRNKVVVSGLWTEVCNNTFALWAMLEGG